LLGQRKIRSDFTPKKFVKFLDEEFDSNLDELGKMLSEIDYIEEYRDIGGA
jgi:hypothetical protein